MAARDDGLSVEKRTAIRVPTPRGTMVLFSSYQRAVDTFYVRDLSEVGMLICTSRVKTIYPINSLITNIVILTPPSIFYGSGDETCKLSSVQIRQGKVVRTIVNSDSTISYGIVFTDGDGHSKKNLTKLISQMSH